MTSSAKRARAHLKRTRTESQYVTLSLCENIAQHGQLQRFRMQKAKHSRAVSKPLARRREARSGPLLARTPFPLIRMELDATILDVYLWAAVQIRDLALESSRPGGRS